MAGLDEPVSGSLDLRNLLVEAYSDLRRIAAANMAREFGPVTIQATELVHETYLRLISSSDGECWRDRSQFFSAAAVAMRRVLIDRARRRQSLKNGGDRTRVPLADVALAADAMEYDILELDEALTRLELSHPRQAAVVKLRFFAGLTLKEISAINRVSEATVDNDWAYARAWLKVELSRNRL